MHYAQAITQPRTEKAHLINDFLEAIRQRLPVVDWTLKEYGHLPLQAYLKQVLNTTSVSYQPREDLGEAIYRYAAPLLGESVARKARAELIQSPVVLTANHHGVDFFAQSVQSSLLFSLQNLEDGETRKTVPVLACGNVPLNNATYPRGALLYAIRANELDEVPRRFPLFPDRFKRQMVARVPGLDEVMIRRATAKVARMCEDREIPPMNAETLREILTQDFCAPEVVGCHAYSDQAVIINERIWQRLFTGASQTPELVYLELEKVSSMLLEADLKDPHSLAFVVILDPALRRNVLRVLDGARGCWQYHELMRRLSMSSQGDEQRRASPQGCGTFLFWGIDDAGRRVPLLLDRGGSKGEMLRGVDDSGNAWEVPLVPQEIVQGLQEGRLLPSLFTCFLVISLARGVTCPGGYYQASYLPVMQHGILTALRQHSDLSAVAELIAKVPTRSYLSGMQAVMCKKEESGLIPAGPVEIIAGGSLGTDDIQRIRSLTVREAHIASLFETITDAAPEAVESAGWKKYLAAECNTLLRDKIVVK